MKLDEFIKNVLVDINKGLNEAEKMTGKKYHIEISSNGKRGVNFDIAITVIDSKTESAEGSAKAGFIQVLGAGVGGKVENKEESSKVSRIQFTVYVPNLTKAQDKEIYSNLSQKNYNYSLE